LTKENKYRLSGLLAGVILLAGIIQLPSCSTSSGKGSEITGSIVHSSANKPIDDRQAKIAKSINATYKSRLLDSIYQVKANRKGFNGNVLIAQQGVVVYQKCFGYANLENKEALKPDTKFQIASMSKTFTAVAILKLMEEGKLKLTDLVSDYFPELPFKKITIEMLLSHRSGLANYVNVYNDKVIRGNLYPTQDEIFKWFKTFDRRFIGKPGRYFEYSNTNYVLLAGIVEKVSGIPFSTFLHKNIFEPLQMNNTWLANEKDPAAFINRTTSYNGFWEREETDYFDGVVGDKGIYSTVLDLYKWYDGLINNRILKSETLQSAWTPRSKEKRGMRNYGYGFRMICFNDSDKVVYHNGWWNSYNSLFYINPMQKFVIIVLGNKYNNDIYDVGSAFQVMSQGSNNTKDYME